MANNKPSASEFLKQFQKPVEQPTAPTVGAKPSASDFLKQFETKPTEAVAEVKPPAPFLSKEFAGQTLKNFPGSAKRLATDLATAVTSPVQTAKAVGTLAGSVQPAAIAIRSLGKIVGQSLESSIPGATFGEQELNAFGDFLSERYGSIEDIKETIRTDPAGFLLDLSGILTAGGGAAARVGTVAKVTRAGQAVARAGAAIDPFRQTARLASFGSKAGARLVGETLGFTSGMGLRNVQEVFNFPINVIKKAFRGEVGDQDILNTARRSLDKLKDKRGQEYRLQLPKIKEAKEIISMEPIRQKMLKTFDDFQIKITKDGALDFSESKLAANVPAQKSVKRAKGLIDMWSQRADEVNASRLDTLKQTMDSVYSPSSDSLPITQSIREEIRNTLIREVPEYKKLIKDYEKASILIEDVEKTFSLVDEAGTSRATAKQAESTLKALTDAMAENKNIKKALIDEFEIASGSELTQQIAAREISSLRPKRGIVGAFLGASAVTGGVLGGLLDAKFIGLLTLASPAIVGSFIAALGVPAALTRRIISFAKAQPAVTAAGKAAAQAPQAAFQAGRIQRVTEEERQR